MSTETFTGRRQSLEDGVARIRFFVRGLQRQGTIQYRSGMTSKPLNQPLPRLVAEQFIRQVEVALAERNSDKIRAIADDVETWMPEAIESILDMSLAEFGGAAGLTDYMVDRLADATTARTVNDLIAIALESPAVLPTVECVTLLAQCLLTVRHLADRRDVVGRGLANEAAERLLEFADRPDAGELIKRRQRADAQFAKAHAVRMESRPIDLRTFADAALHDEGSAA